MSDSYDQELMDLLDELDALDEELADDDVTADVELSTPKVSSADVKDEVQPEPEIVSDVSTEESCEPDFEEPSAEVEQVEATPVETPSEAKSTFAQRLDPRQLAADVSINTADLSASFVDQASKFVEYATLAHRLQHKADRLKNQLEFVEMEVDKELRDELIAEGKKVVESALTKAVVLDSRVVEAKEKLADAKMVAALAKESLEAFKQRRDMLVQMGAAQREELRGELYMKAKSEEISSQKEAYVNSKRA